MDEVGELAPPMQAILLRLIQNRESKRLGTVTPRILDIRIIAATNRDLREMVAENTFREDLYHRLSTVELRVPGLSERSEDIPILTNHFLAVLCERYGRPLKTFSATAQRALIGYSWPGSVRELECVVDYCCLMCISDLIEVEDLPDFVTSSTSEQHKAIVSLAEMESIHLAAVLERFNGNREDAAKALGISRATVYRMLADSTNKNDWLCISTS